MAPLEAHVSHVYKPLTDLWRGAPGGTGRAPVPVCVTRGAASTHGRHQPGRLGARPHGGVRQLPRLRQQQPQVEQRGDS